MKRYFIFIILSVFLMSCAHVISKEAVERAAKDIPFNTIRNNTDAYINKTFILGGTIVETKNTKEGTEIEVVQVPVDRYGYLIDRDMSEGRFIIITSRHLDPAIYRNERSITFAGRLTGSRKKILGELEYDYPVFEAKEIFLWKEERFYQPYPYMYDPYYYPYLYYTYPYYWHNPFIYRPYFYP